MFFNETITMGHAMDESRQDLRKRILRTRDRLSELDRGDKSFSVMNNFLSLPEMRQWTTLFMYVNFRSEVETVELIKRCLRQGIRVAIAFMLLKGRIDYLIEYPISIRYAAKRR